MEIKSEKCPLCKVEVVGYGPDNYKKNMMVHLIAQHHCIPEEIEWDGYKIYLVKKEAVENKIAEIKLKEEAEIQKEIKKSKTSAVKKSKLADTIKRVVKGGRK